MSEEVAKYNISAIAEMTNGIILANYKKDDHIQEPSFQTEMQLENDMIKNLVSQGYEKLEATSNEDLYKNLKVQIERLNKVTFTPEEWRRFLIEYLDAPMTA